MRHFVRNMPIVTAVAILVNVYFVEQIIRTRFQLNLN